MKKYMLLLCCNIITLNSLHASDAQTHFYSSLISSLFENANRYDPQVIHIAIGLTLALITIIVGTKYVQAYKPNWLTAMIQQSIAVTNDELIAKETEKKLSKEVLLAEIERIIDVYENFVKIKFGEIPTALKARKETLLNEIKTIEHNIQKLMG